MKRFTTTWTAAVAASALLMLPATGAAQEPPPTPPPAQTQTGTTDTTAAQAAAQDQADAQEARRLLTEARNTLSEMTQLPQAAQLSGEARTQVSQLIANFNELIAAQSNWRASFDKVETNLVALLGPERPMPGTTGTVAGTTGTTGETETAGTTGGAIVDVAPEIREKLIEFRVKLNEFEMAAGGTATGAMPPATPPAEPQTDPAVAARAPIDEAEVLRHIEAIEAILSANEPAAAGASGVPPTTPPGTPPAAASPQPVTLSPAQLAQLRMHLTQLRALIER